MPPLPLPKTAIRILTSRRLINLFPTQARFTNPLKSRTLAFRTRPNPLHLCS
ncbi:hypothetical protein [Rubritalea tangerina]|uniref:hypothetical protein n=1 Tax=Rubritalea tangerina TaxID=430798 RepID=UPI003617E013